MEGPLISVIVPVYKVEPYLDKCISSIVNQTYKNLEIILQTLLSFVFCGCKLQCMQYNNTKTHI